MIQPIKKNHFFFCFLFFFGCISGIQILCAQNQGIFYNLDSLKNYSYEELYSKENLYRARDPAIAKIYATAYLHKAKNQKDTVEIVNGYLQLGSIVSEKVALKYYDSVIAFTKENKSFMFPGFAYLNKGVCYYFLGNYKESLENYLIAHKLSIKNNNTDHILYTKRGIADIKEILGNYKEVLAIRKSLISDLLKNPPTTFGEIESRGFYLEALYLLSDSYISNKKLDSAMYYAKKGFSESLKNPDSLHYYNFEFQLGKVAYFKNDFKTALDRLSKAEKNPEFNQDINYYKGNIYLKQEQKEKTFFLFKKVDSIFDITKNVTPEVRNVQEFFINHYKEQNDIDNQLKHIDKLLYVDSVIVKNNIYLNETIFKEYDTPLLLAEKEKIIKSLTSDNKKSFLIIIGLAALVLIAIALIFQSYKKQLLYKKRFAVLVSEKNSKKQSTVTYSYKLDDIAKEVVDNILVGLGAFESSHGFLDTNISLNSLAKSLQTNSSYLSKVINHFKQQNFSMYLSDLRIEYSIDRLQKDCNFKKFTILAIANDSGFSTSESYAKTFYKRTGIYPSYFIKELEKQS